MMTQKQAQQVVAGAMGGSASAAMALEFLLPDVELIVHEGYELPLHAPEHALYLAVSYSGTTEETLSFAQQALAGGKALAAVSSGGALEALAQEGSAPFFLVESGLVPRNALIPMTVGVLTLCGYEPAAHELNASLARAEVAEEAGALAAALKDKTPIFYTSERNRLLGRIGKMFCNESIKIPAFASVLPARNHDELQGFDQSGPHASRNSEYVAVFMHDAHDHPRILRRMEVMREMLPGLGVEAHTVALGGGSRAAQLAQAFLLVKEAARQCALACGVDPDSMPLTEVFKKKL